MKTVIPRKATVRGREVWLVRNPKELGGGRKYFATETGAARHARDLNEQLQTPAAPLLALPRHDQVALVKLVDDFGSDIPALVAAAHTGRPNRVAVKTLEWVCAECVKSKVAANRRATYTGALTRSLKRFRLGVRVENIGDVTREKIEAWLDAQNWKPKTRSGALIDLQTLFAFALERGYVKANPVTAIPRPTEEDKTPQALSVADTRALLSRCRHRYPEMAAWVALQLFGGLRAIEAQRITRDAVRDGYVRLEGKHAKTRSKRLVQVNETLESWLAIPGDWPPKGRAEKLRKLSAGLPSWTRNALRHSFCSYALPILGVARTALEAGHSERVLLKDYRALVTRADALAYWALIPAAV